MAFSRRHLIGGMTASLAAGPALAKAEPLSRHPAFRIWTSARMLQHAPLTAPVTTLTGTRLTLGQWMGGEAAIVIYWATWCPPCLSESPDLNRLQARLKAAGARTAIRPVHAFDDDADLAKARAVLNKLGASGLETVQASPALEKAALGIFGKSPVQPDRTSLPALMMVAADGRIVATRIGSPDPEKGQPAYWNDPRTLDMLTRLGTLA
jgi:thiol-disulfide isomerase/thioredoxin